MGPITDVTLAIVAATPEHRVTLAQPRKQLLWGESLSFCLSTSLLIYAFMLPSQGGWLALGVYQFCRSVALWRSRVGEDEHLCSWSVSLAGV